MAISAEKELETFLAGLPVYQRKYFEVGLSLLDQEETEQFNNWVPTEDFVLTSGVHRILLSQVPTKLKEQRERMKQEQQEFSQIYLDIALPKTKKGRKVETELAERIWKFKAEGKTVPQMQAIFKEEGQHFTREKIESYLKTRRKSLN